MSKQYQNLLNLTQASEAVGVTRKTLYSHINKGLVSVIKQGSKRFIDVSELIRYYGSVTLPEEKLSNVTQSQSKQNDDTILAMQRELVELRKLFESQQLLLADMQKTRLLQEQVNGLQNERDEMARQLAQVKHELVEEQQKGLWKRIFSKRSS